MYLPPPPVQSRSLPCLVRFFRPLPRLLPCSLPAVLSLCSDQTPATPLHPPAHPCKICKLFSSELVICAMSVPNIDCHVPSYVSSPILSTFPLSSRHSGPVVPTAPWILSTRRDLSALPSFPFRTLHYTYTPLPTTSLTVRSHVLTLKTGLL